MPADDPEKFQKINLISMAYCSSCRKVKISGTMAKSKLNTGAITEILSAAAGVIAARMANKITFISANPMIGGAVKAGVGFFLTSQKNKMVASAGLGMAAVGATELIGSFLPEGTLGWLPSGSTTLPGVAGAGYRPQIMVD